MNRKQLPDNVELRFATYEVRQDDDGGLTIVGHPATFDDTYDLGPFEERIAPGAFDDVMDDDVRALWNHDPNIVLGRTSSGTLRLAIEERGLAAEIDLPQSAVAQREAIERGDVTEMSFGFVVAEDEWEEREDDKDLRTIKKVGQLFDVSPVTFPANPNTDVALRSRDQLIEARNAKREKVEIEAEKRRRALRLLELANR